MRNPIIDLPLEDRFKLDPAFTATYRDVPPPWGFGLFSELVYQRTYAREMDNGEKEQWADTVQRVTQGTFTVLKWHCLRHNLPWDDVTAQEKAQTFFDGMFNLRWTPPGRGLWMMGTEFVYERGSTSLNSCAMISTKNFSEDPAYPFVWAFTKSMHGVGVGYNVDGTYEGLQIQDPEIDEDWIHVVEDSREGWAAVIRCVIEAFTMPGKKLPGGFDMTMIRPKGTPIKGFGGVASGPKPLADVLIGGDLKGYYARIPFVKVEKGYNSDWDVDLEVPGLIKRFNDWRNAGRHVDSELIVDVFNMLGRCVVSGGVRRSAMISLGAADDTMFMDLKVDHEAPESGWWRWCSNNSIITKVGDNYRTVAERIGAMGEPGLFWRKNAQDYGRMCDPPNYKDTRAEGTNPCCLPGFSRLLTPEGVRTLDEIDVGSVIWSEDGWVNVTAKWRTGVKPVLEYRTTAGAFTGTDNHRVVQRGEKVEVRDAETIDRLVGPVVDVEIDAQAVLDGWMVGDGTRAPARCRDGVYLILGKDDEAIYDSEVAHLIKGQHVTGGEGCVAVETTIRRSELPPLPQREIPERFQFGTPDIVASFLRGLYSANGSVVADGRRVTYKTTSPMMRDQIQTMLSSIGIGSYFTTNKPTEIVWDNGTFVSKESYDINITSDRFVFAEIVGFVQPYKQEKIQGAISSRGKGTYEIREVKPLGEFEVFDITVDGEHHTFWTDGVNVSNCEQTLESNELCCLVETRPARHATLVEYKRTLKDAYLYAKAVTLIPTDDPNTNKVMMKNRRIGLSMTGVRQSMELRGAREHYNWCDASYKYIQELDEEYSNWLGTARSIKTTSIKPSGTVSLLCGSTPGVHAAFSEYQIRRMRLAASSPILQICRDAGIPVEEDVASADTWVIEYPIHMQHVAVTEATDTIENQFEVAAEMQRVWADNQVSCTVKFRQDEAHKIEGLLRTYDRHLKGISLMLHSDHGYPQAPYEEITAEEYELRRRAIDWGKLNTALYAGRVALEHDQEDKFCDGDACLLPGFDEA